MATRAEVHHLYLKLIETLGLEAADTLMELLRTGHDWRRAPDEATGSSTSTRH